MMNGTLYLRVDPGESLCKSILEAPQIISTGVVAIFTAPEAAPCRKEDAV